MSDRRKLAPRTSEDEAFFIANKYAQNKLILEAKLANSLNGGRAVRQTMLDEVAAELSAKFNIANRSRKYVEQKLRDMKKEARKFFFLQQNAKLSINSNNLKSSALRIPPEPIRVMIEAMSDELSGSSWNDVEHLYEKQLKLENCEDLRETDRDIRSHQSASSSCESALNFERRCASTKPTFKRLIHSNLNSESTLVDNSNINTEQFVKISRCDTNLKSSNDTVNLNLSSLLTDSTLNSSSLSAANWQTIYNQSLINFGAGQQSFTCNSKAVNNTTKASTNLLNKPSAWTTETMNLVSNLKHLMDDSSDSGTNFMDVDGLLNSDDQSTKNILKVIAASSLFFPAGPAASVPSISGVGELVNCFDVNGLLSSANKLNSFANANNNCNKANSAQKAKDDSKNSNPSSPLSMSASTSSVESLQPFRVDDSTNNLHAITSSTKYTNNKYKKAIKNFNNCSTTNENNNINRSTETAKPLKETDYCGSRSKPTPVRIRHSILKRLGVNFGSVNSLGLDYRRSKLGALQRKLLLEEINASRAFTSLCEKIQQSVQSVAKKLEMTQSLQANLLRAHLNKEFLSKRIISPSSTFKNSEKIGNDKLNNLGIDIEDDEVATTRCSSAI